MKRKNILASGLLAAALFAAAPVLAFAASGVSVNTGKIILDKSIMPGGTYELPNIEVKNIGDQPSDYGMSVEYNEVQSQMKPDASWFSFTPAKFNLASGESKIVKVKISLPASAKAGDYFAYVEAHSEKTDTSSVSGAAATKLYLSVASGNAFSAAYLSLRSFVQAHSPWTYVALLIIDILLLVAIWKRLHHIAKANSTTVQ